MIDQALLPQGGPRQISPAVAAIFLKQIEVCAGANFAAIGRAGSELGALLDALPADQRAQAHAIALSLVNLIE